MCIASGMGLILNESLATDAAFTESPGRFLMRTWPTLPRRFDGQGVIVVLQKVMNSTKDALYHR